MQLLDAGRHLLGGRDEQGGQADRVGLVLHRGVDDRVHRHLLAEVDHRVAVVGEDRVDERLADVVHVAEDGGDHDLALRVALDPVEVVLELRHGALHHLGRLEHERQDQLAGAELVAHLLHGGQQHLVQRRHRADLLDRAVDPVLHARPSCGAGCASGAPPRAPCPRWGPPPASSSCLALLLEVGDEALERVLAAVEDQVVGELALLRRRSRGTGVMWFGLTIARSRPASTQWWRNTELSTARATGETPKETFETPSEVFTPGSSSLMRRMPSIVSTAHGRHSSSPVVSVKVSASKISSSRIEPVLVAGDVADALGDLELALAPSWPCRPRRS